MSELYTDVAVIGGGPAGLAAAIGAKREGAARVMILERDHTLGGILQQCIHPGFGLTRFREELTGPEYYARFVKEAEALGVQPLLDTTVLGLDAEAGKITCVNTAYGITTVHAKSTVLAMGCRERTRAQITVPGTRPAGIYTAGSAQRLINRQNILIGKRIVIVGSGDIGMIMARRMKLEGADVVMVVEIMDYLAGLTRNRIQCLDDFNIPLKLSYTVTRIEGERRVTGVYIAPVDENRCPIPEKEDFVPCDTVLFSVGLIPENEIIGKTGILIDSVTNGPSVNQYMQTSEERVFACGNAVHVNDLVDHVSDESERAGRFAARYSAGMLPATQRVLTVCPGRNVRYTCPQKICLPEEGDVTVFFRVQKPGRNIWLTASVGGKELRSERKVRVNPGEMDCLKINFSGVTEGEVLVSAEAEE